MKLNNPNLLKSDIYLNGQWRSSDQYFTVVNPATKTEIVKVADAGAAATAEAIKAAQTAFLNWRKRTATERAGLLGNWYNLVMEHLEDLALILTREQGKPLAEARGEIKYGASFIQWFSEEARRGYGDVIPGHAQDKRITVVREPVGVVAAITPWNFPNAMITRKVAPALAAGCTVVLKPAEDTPLSALALAYLAEQAGIPPGVFNVLPTSRPQQVGKILTDSPVVRKLSFTGSTAVGKLLMKQSAGTLKKLSLELGGNAPFIVFDDADIPGAVAGAMRAKFRNAGQTCVCANRLFVHTDVYEEFTRALGAEIKSLTVGNGTGDDVEVGPLINADGLHKVEAIVTDAIDKGATLHTGGERHPAGDLFFQPTMLTNVNESMRVASEEIFGPVAPIFRFETEAEVIQLANDTPFGLAAYFYGRDVSRCWRVAEALEYGMVGINTGMVSTAVAPFGGVKESGFGREGSRYGMDEYMTMKYMCWGV